MSAFADGRLDRAHGGPASVGGGVPPPTSP